MDGRSARGRAGRRRARPAPARLGYIFCLATMWSLALSYVACGTIFFFTSSSFALYGRPSMIFFA